ncbi:MAG: cell division protein ZapB [Spirochaetaceae bacterium]|jgi:hypothetical protein|nr:cell division protein ZapB [Spirochaetaceae bacterium]
MVTLEQVRLLETKVARAIDYVKKVTDENTLLRGKIDTYQKRIDELEVLVQRFKEDQSRIEEGIISALERLNQFEDAIEKSLSTVQTAAGYIEKAVPGGTRDPEAKGVSPEAPGTDLSPEPEKDAVPQTPGEPDSDAAIMAALEAEEQAAREAAAPGGDNTAELDIF